MINIVFNKFFSSFYFQMPYLNPARSLGPAFVLNKWDNHWVYWMGPMVGGAISALIYKYVFSPRRAFKLNKEMENDSASISDDDTNFDLDLDKPNMQQPKFHGSSYRSPTGTMQQQSVYCQNLYSTGTGLGSKMEQVEPLYGGTRSMYCKSPPLTRANLNRSQSVYAKSNTAINRESLPRPGPLVPAQSLYPMRINQTQSSHLQNQNVQNQLQQRSESIYGIRSSVRQEQRTIQPDNGSVSFQSVYGVRNNPSPGDAALCKFEREPQREVRDESKMFLNRACRPDSMYGVAQRRGQSTQSDDSSYGSYHGPTPTSSTPQAQQPTIRQQSCDIMMTSNYATQPPSMRTQSQTDRKTSVNGGIVAERQQYVQNPKVMHNGNGNVAPLTHQYNLQPIRPN